MFLLHFHSLNTACGINKVTHAHTNTHIPYVMRSCLFFKSFIPLSLFFYCFFVLFLNVLFLPVSVFVFSPLGYVFFFFFSSNVVVFWVFSSF